MYQDDINYVNIMRPSKNQIKKAGLALKENKHNKEAFDLINNWRTLHAQPLLTFRNSLNYYFSTRQVGKTIVQRLKRMPTIVSKILGVLG